MPSSYVVTLTDQQDALAQQAAEARGLAGVADLIARFTVDHLRVLYRDAATEAAAAQIEQAAQGVGAGVTVEPLGE